VSDESSDEAVSAGVQGLQVGIFAAIRHTPDITEGPEDICLNHMAIQDQKNQKIYTLNNFF
jgi:hypothetical protein